MPRGLSECPSLAETLAEYATPIEFPPKYNERDQARGGEGGKCDTVDYVTIRHVKACQKPAIKRYIDHAGPREKVRQRQAVTRSIYPQDIPVTRESLLPNQPAVVPLHRLRV